MLLPLIMDESHAENVSIDKMSRFIDFFNYVPVLIADIRHKNNSSTDLYLFMGANSENNYKKNGEFLKTMSDEQQKKV
jgi:hypothetical protein